MGAQNLAYFAMNRGLVSRLGLARVDVKRLALAAEVYLNYVPRVLGSMMLRPGTGYKGSTKADAAARFLPFIFSTSDTALVELTNQIMRIWVDDALITRPAVATAIVNGAFTVNLANWTDNDEAGAASVWVAGGYMGLTGTGTAAAIRDQQVSVAVGDRGIEHFVDIAINRGPVTLLIGSVVGGEDYVAETTLGTGTHSFAFTPTGDFWIRYMSRLERQVLVESCGVGAAGVFELATPWTTAQLNYVRADQSGDVIFVACDGVQQKKIERHAVHSWSIVNYQPEDGPFRLQNTGPCTLTPSALSGNGTLTASIPLFHAAQAGALFALTSVGQTVAKNMALLNDATASIRVTGVTTDRTITIILSGMTAGRTVILQRSFDNAAWVAVAGETWAADVTTAYVDGLDNQIVYYRLILTVVGAAGTTVATLSIPTGSIRGVCRITGVTNSTTADIEIFTDFGATDATDTWEEGRWSDYRGWPTAVGFYEGRLAWAGKDAVTLSVSDGFESFDSTVEGDSAPIDRTIGSGPVDTINWILPLQRLMLGGQGAEFSCRSTAFDEPLTPTNFNLKKASRQGSSPVSAVEADDSGVFVQRGGMRVYALEFDGNKLDYKSVHLSALVPKIGSPGIVRIAVQRQPDTRIHFVRSDGTVAMLVFDANESVTCWVEIESDGASGLVEDVVVLPSEEGEQEDHVYYVVKRTINGATKRYLERWATEEECRGVDDAGNVTAQCLIADSYVVSTGIPRTIINGLDHLEGEQVVVWADGVDVGHDADDALIYTVTGGLITLAEDAEEVVVGLPYTAQWQSGKMVQLSNQLGSAMKKQKNLPQLGMILADVHRKGVKFGPDFDHLDDLPSVEDGAPVDADAVRTEYDGNPFIFPSKWSVDSRICLQSIAPRPCTILAFSAEVDF